jgi:acyl carrier protein
MTSEEKLQTAFRDVLGLGPETVFEKLAYRHTDGWDSIAHMQLVIALEMQFGIMLETEDLIGMSSYPKAKEIVTKYGVTF